MLKLSVALLLLAYAGFHTFSSVGEVEAATINPTTIATTVKRNPEPNVIENIITDISGLVGGGIQNVWSFVVGVFSFFFSPIINLISSIFPWLKQ